MAQFSLTDEEKIKLESLLSDIDSEEYSMEYMHDAKTKTELKSIQRQIKKENGETSTYNTLEEDVDGHVNEFKLKKEEVCTIEDLDVKLHEILKSYDEKDGKVKQVLLTKNNCEDMLQSADNEGRYWEHHQLQKRLETIEKDLANIAARDAEERENLEKRNEELIQENDKLDEEKNDNSCF